MKDIKNVSRVIETWIRIKSAGQNHPPTPFKKGEKNKTSFKEGNQNETYMTK